MDVVSTQYILGIRSTLRGMLIDPSIPPKWDGFAVERQYRGHTLRIKVHNPDHVQHGIVRLSINGVRVDARDGACIPEELLGKNDVCIVDVEMGLLIAAGTG